MAIRMTKPWVSIDAAALTALPGQLGVFELADAAGEVIFIGRADARSPFGLRGEIARCAAAIAEARTYRLEITTAYHTRHLELLMTYRADHSRLPKHNAPIPGLGRLSPLQDGAGSDGLPKG
jgi:hypothetical protein